MASQYVKVRGVGGGRGGHGPNVTPHAAILLSYAERVEARKKKKKKDDDEES